MDLLQSNFLERADAWLAYRCAFEDFSEKARTVQSLTSNVNSDAAEIERALVELERARIVYSNARDAVAQQLGAASANEVAPQVTPGTVRGLAELLWEAAGKPDGTSHDHWYRAEDIARRAGLALKA